MNLPRITEAASLLAAARQQQTLIDLFSATCRPRSIAEAHAIQDAVTAMLGAEVIAFKASAATQPGSLSHAISDSVRAPIYAATTRASPARIPAALVPQCGVEGEVAFRFRYDLPPRSTAYTREEVAASVDACAAIELVTSRFADPAVTTLLDRLADCVSNGGFIHGETITNWLSLDFATLTVILTVNGETVVEQSGGHPTGDPLANVVALVELLRPVGGVKVGQFVTCGSYTGLRYLKPGDTCGVRFSGLGSAEVEFMV